MSAFLGREMTIDIRLATPKDATAISIVLSSAYQHQQPVALANALRDGGHFHQEIVADRDGLLLGYVALVKLASPQNWVALSLLSVSLSVQDQGVGERLVVAAQDAARASRVDAIMAFGGRDYLKRYHFSVPAAANLQGDLATDKLSLYPIKPGTALSDETVEYPEPFAQQNG